MVAAQGLGQSALDKDNSRHGCLPPFHSTGLGTVLGFNFVVIVGLFLWFLSGVFSLYALDNDTIIIAVKAAFDPFILPLLSTHMGLTFLSYGLEKAFGEGDPEDDGGFRL